jgi:bifunctional DNA-binding transcriptional regulator/antitoxin component of YhaV-PrlF toxin-antitoxin module
MQMQYETTLSSKGQFTIPKPIRDHLKADAGRKFSVRIVGKSFIATPKHPSNIMSFAGWLRKKDDGVPLSKIRKRSQELAAKEIVSRWK